MKESFKKAKPIFKVNRSSQISVRMTTMERKLIQYRAKETGYSMSSFMVKSSLTNSLKTLSVEEKNAYIELAKYHTNFSRISSLLKSNKPILEELESLMKEIRDHLKQFQHDK